MSELQEVKNDVKGLRAELKANTDLTRKGFETMNGRVKKLELKEAERKGRESVVKSDYDWKTITKALIGIISTAVAIAYLYAQAVFK